MYLFITFLIQIPDHLYFWQALTLLTKFTTMKGKVKKRFTKDKKREYSRLILNSTSIIN